MKRTSLFDLKAEEKNYPYNVKYLFFIFFYEMTLLCFRLNLAKSICRRVIH